MLTRSYQIPNHGTPITAPAGVISTHTHAAGTAHTQQQPIKTHLLAKTPFIANNNKNNIKNVSVAKNASNNNNNNGKPEDSALDYWCFGKDLSDLSPKSDKSDKNSSSSSTRDKENSNKNSNKDIDSNVCDMIDNMYELDSELDNLHDICVNSQSNDNNNNNSNSNDNRSESDNILHFIESEEDNDTADGISTLQQTNDTSFASSQSQISKNIKLSNLNNSAISAASSNSAVSSNVSAHIALNNIVFPNIPPIAPAAAPIAPTVTTVTPALSTTIKNDGNNSSNSSNNSNNSTHSSTASQKAGKMAEIDAKSKQTVLVGSIEPKIAPNDKQATKVTTAASTVATVTTATVPKATHQTSKKLTKIANIANVPRIMLPSSNQFNHQVPSAINSVVSATATPTTTAPTVPTIPAVPGVHPIAIPVALPMHHHHHHRPIAMTPQSATGGFMSPQQHSNYSNYGNNYGNYGNHMYYPSVGHAAAHTATHPTPHPTAFGFNYPPIVPPLQPLQPLQVPSSITTTPVGSCLMSPIDSMTPQMAPHMTTTHYAHSMHNTINNTQTHVKPTPHPLGSMTPNIASSINALTNLTAAATHAAMQNNKSNNNNHHYTWHQCHPALPNITNLANLSNISNNNSIAALSPTAAATAHAVAAVVAATQKQQQQQQQQQLANLANLGNLGHLATLPPNGQCTGSCCMPQSHNNINNINNSINSINNNININNSRLAVQSPRKLDISNYLRGKPSLQTMLNDDRKNYIVVYQGNETHCSLLQSLCELNEGSRHIQRELDDSINYWKKNVTSQKNILERFYCQIQQFADKLCVQLYGNYVINKFLSLAQQCIADAMENAMKNLSKQAAKSAKNSKNNNSTKNVSVDFSSIGFDNDSTGIMDLLLRFLDEIIYENLEQLMSNQYSCRIIQNILNTDNTQLRKHALHILITKLKDNEANNLIHTISTNQNGNHIIQAIVEKSCQLGSEKSVKFIENYILDNLSQLSVHQYACRVVQSVIQCQIINKKLIKELYNHLAVLCNDESGNYAVQRCIEFGSFKIRESYIEWIFFARDANVRDYSTQGSYTMASNHSYHYQQGRRANNNCNNGKTSGNNTVDSKKHCSASGQSSVESSGSSGNKSGLNNAINYDKFSFGKYSSNVCDLAFKFATVSQKMRLIKHLTKNLGSDRYGHSSEFELINTTMFGLVNHQYGNFVAKNIILHLLKCTENSDISVNCLVRSNNSNNNNSLHSIKQSYHEMTKMLFDYLQAIHHFLKSHQRRSTFTYSKNIVTIVDKYAPTKYY